jgi:hypothetical protein
MSYQHMEEEGKDELEEGEGEREAAAAAFI